ncbi:glycosyltransferase [Photobacterium damselae]|uniref:glycosyltransferase n=1 Tax=Photobacterium damselae TaxID=38293 RepID=UPI0025434700|nr:glycosyltransferase [Photobacterium damselae]WIH20122.1 glycosyltransferase [Photobacterium damselae]
MKNILIVAPYCSIPTEPYFNRFLFLAELLSSEFNVTLITSDFRHFDKTHRKYVASDKFRLVLLHEPGYKKNVSIARVLSHKVFTENFNTWVNSSDNFNFDLVYSAAPLLQTNIILSNLKEKVHFKLIVDVQDVWPEAISAAIPILNNVSMRFIPFYRKANRVYSSADGLVAVSKTYLDRARLVNKTADFEVVYIGSDFKLINNSKSYKKNNDKFILTYLGTLSFSYDIETIIHAVNKLLVDGYPIELHIFGGGPFESKLKNISSSNIFFHGFVDISHVYSFMKTSDIAINALSSTAKQSVTNKLSDFMSLGIPILNSQTNTEVLDLLETLDHENYIAGNVDSAYNKIISFFERRDELTFKPNKNFNRDIEYKRIIDLIDRLIKND